VCFKKLKSHLDRGLNYKIAGIFSHVAIAGNAAHLFHHFFLSVGGQKHDGEGSGSEYLFCRFRPAHACAEINIHQHKVNIMNVVDKRNSLLTGRGHDDLVAEVSYALRFRQGNQGLIFHEKECFLSHRFHGVRLPSAIQ